MIQIKNTWKYFCKRTYQKIVIFEECTTLKAIQPLAQSPSIHPSRETWERGCPDPHEVLRYTYFYFKSQCKFHLLKNVIDTSSSPPLSSFATNITSLQKSSSSSSLTSSARQDFNHHNQCNSCHLFGQPSTES